LMKGIDLSPVVSLAGRQAYDFGQAWRNFNEGIYLDEGIGGDAPQACNKVMMAA
jgi:hypothetical protein